ncbi:MAG: thiamine phosphate synthase [Bacteroidetes bacterium]|nr:thiamine phosphate synthase [Bacteroidota bacterium]MBT4337982.1 thiamine phosphate synthase [Bacteroidota bacterium]MBT4727052.1 thiamine phosphate synthase [Bacteroidota bacterium]MBT4969003.1 thiamine phosphate synthase [Bacteroidota bacterium]MBT5991457.1 thiamine phosphate synthase [Bacteroidota bacterium]
MEKKSKKIIVLSSGHRVKDEAKILTAMFEEGMTHLHLRKHGYPRHKIEELLNSIPEKYHQQIILHSHLEFANKFNIGGIHITRKKRKNWLFLFFTVSKFKKKPGFILTTSYHSTRKIENAPKYYSYFLLNSLFGSIHKGGRHAYKEPDKLKEFLRATNRDIVALGGIDLINIKSVTEIGFRAVGLHGGIWGFDNPLEKFKDLRDAYLSN